MKQKNETAFQTFTNGKETITIVYEDSSMALAYAKIILGNGAVNTDPKKVDIEACELDEKRIPTLQKTLLYSNEKVYGQIMIAAKVSPAMYPAIKEQMIKIFNFGYEQGRKVGIEIAQFIPQDDGTEPPVESDKAIVESGIPEL
jgi:hypothetical protein